MRLPAIVLLTAMLILASGCSLFARDGEGSATLGSEATLSGEAILVCGKECADRGQCGSADAGQMVLLSSTRPLVSGHDIAATAGTVIIISQQQMETVVEISTNNSLEVPYYQVDVPGRGFAWVAGWCIGQ